MRTRTIISAAALAFLVWPISVGAQTQQQIDQCLNKDGAFTSGMQISGCTAVIWSARRRSSASAWAFRNRCDAHNANRESDLALEDCNQAIRLDPNDAVSYRNRGDAYADKNDLRRALADYSEAIRLNPKDAEAYAARARILRGTGDFKRAITDLDQAITLNPEDGYPYRERGVTLFSLGDLQAAAADFLRSTQHSEDVYAMIYRFVTQAHMGQNGAAELAANAEKLQTRSWPYPVIELLLGKQSTKTTLAFAVSPDQKCEATFYVGEWYFIHHNDATARSRFRVAVNICPKSFGEYAAASAELKRFKH